MMFLIRFWSNLTKKDSVERLLNMKKKKKKLRLYSQFKDVFFIHGSGFSTAPDPD